MKIIQKEIIKSIIASGAALITDIACLAFFSYILNINYIAAIILSFSFGALVNYALSTYWVFSFRALNNKSLEFSIFFLVGVISLLMSILLMAMLVDILGIHLLAAKLITTGLTFIVNFAGRRILLFSKKPTKKSSNAVVLTQL
jgi:putative flippase GtrA